MSQSPVRLKHELGGIVDKSGRPIADGAATDIHVFEATSRSPVKAPNGRHVTLGEFNRASGGISLKETDQGTHAVLRLSGLIPFGLYSLQLALLGPMGTRMGVGSLDDDANRSTFVADDQGAADVSVTHRAGALSGSGKVSSCWQADGMNAVMQQPMAQVIGNYHIDGKTDGPPGSFVPQFSFTFLRLIRWPNELRDGKGNAITDATPPDTPVFEYRKGNPVYAPGTSTPPRQLTLGEFQQACGSIAVKCITGGTHTAIQVTGLIPKGVYTIWLAKPDPTDMTKLVGVGALGKNDGSQNHFTADQNGEADISGIFAAGNLSDFGSISQCWPNDEPIVQVGGVYHIDGNTYGPVIGPDGTYAAQFAFVFAKPPTNPPQ